MFWEGVAGFFGISVCIFRVKQSTDGSCAGSCVEERHSGIISDDTLSQRDGFQKALFLFSELSKW